jgi:2-keto-4-pentenoate hydratase/2-oxohepta-3-ene-1,7-dioic acid hydratase in catechol pathway
MKIIRYQDANNKISHGRQFDNGAVEQLAGELLTGLTPTGRAVTPAKLLAPIVPALVIGIGLNYRHHANETGAKIPNYPIVFLKGPNTIQNPGDPIYIPVAQKSDEVDYECELGVIIGKPCKNANRADALNYVFGYTCANDVSARDWQIKRGGGQWTRGKNYDTFCPLGPCIVTVGEIPNPNTLRIRTLLNGEAVQDWNTGDMIFDVPALIEFLSASTTLPAGTVIITGTPHGVGMAARPPRWLKPGDIVTVDIENIGQLTNPVEMEK